jgi:hypothetical protein
MAFPPPRFLRRAYSVCMGNLDKLMKTFHGPDALDVCQRCGMAEVHRDAAVCIDRLRNVIAYVDDVRSGKPAAGKGKPNPQPRAHRAVPPPR